MTKCVRYRHVEAVPQCLHLIGVLSDTLKDYIVYMQNIGPLFILFF